MLNKFSQQVKTCYRRAEEAERLAEQQTDPEFRADYLEVARRWRKLARGYELNEQAHGFIQDKREARSSGQASEGKTATIYRLLQNKPFEPENIECLVIAYEAALKFLRLSDRDDAFNQSIAQRIIEIAQTGVRDPAELAAVALKDFDVPQEP